MNGDSGQDPGFRRPQLPPPDGEPQAAVPVSAEATLVTEPGQPLGGLVLSASAGEAEAVAPGQAAPEAASTAEQAPRQELEAISEHERHERLRGMVADLGKASKVSVSEAEAAVHASAERAAHVSEREGRLAVRHGGGDPSALESRLTAYTSTVELTGQYGALDKESAAALDRDVRVHSGPPEIAGFSDRNLADALRIYSNGPVDSMTAQPSEIFDVSSVIQALGLDDETAGRLREIAHRAASVTASPNEGSNFLYRYSKPFIEVGAAEDGTLKARVGITQIHRNDGAGQHLVTFQGVDVPVDRALSAIEGYVKPLAEQAEAAKGAAATAPNAEALREQITTELAARTGRFLEQFEREAPEFAGLGRERLTALLAEASRGEYADTLGLSPLETIAVETMSDPDARLRVGCAEDGTMLPKSSMPRAFFEPRSYLTANGRTRTVTRIDFDGDPGSFARPGKEIGRSELPLNDEAYAQTRAQMLETRLIGSTPEAA